MAKPSTTKGGRFRVLLGNDQDNPTEYVAPCGFLSKSMTLTKALEEVILPDCDDPDLVPWAGRDATSLSITVSGEGVAAAESIDAWVEAWESTDSWPVKIEIEFPAKTLIWTGRMHVGTLTLGHPSAQGRVTNNVEMSSDGEMTRVTDAAAVPANTLLPSISGIAQEGVTLTTNVGSWSGWPTSYAYQWQEDNEGWANIVGATGKTYVPVAGNVGNALRVVVTAINSAGAGGPATSAATAAVVGA